MALRCGQREPLVGLEVALPGALARRVHSSQVKLSGGKLLLGSFAIPVHRFGVDLETPPALLVAEPQLVLRRSVTFRRQTAKALLSLRNALLRGFAGPFYRFGRIFRDAQADRVGHSQI